MLSFALVLACTIAILAFVRVRRARKQAPTLPKGQAPDTFQYIVAVHEAGHAIAALRCPLVTSVDRIHIAPDGGYVSYVIRGDDVRTMWCSTVILLAGVAAEVMIYGRFRSGRAASDLAKARSLAETLVLKGFQVPSGARARHTLDFAAMFETRPDPKVAAVLQAAYTTSRALLDKHQAQHGRLTGALLAFGSMQSPETWFGDRRFLRALRLMDVPFV